MIVRCVIEYPTEDQLVVLGPKFFKNRRFDLTKGKEYIVVSLTIVLEPGSAGKGVIIDYVSDSGFLVSAPLCLFAIVDASVSRYWHFRNDQDEAIFLWPLSFYREYFHDDLSEGVPEVVREFKRMKELIEAEAIGRPAA